MADFVGSTDATRQQQEQLEEMADLMRLKETNPAEFEEYLQMAADAAKLAAEKPEVFASLLEGRPGTDDSPGNGGGEALSGARAERLRAMEAAAEITGTRAKASGQKADINIPGVGSKGAGGVKMKPQGIMISPRPGFVIKSKVMDSGIKVFVNICQHERIGKCEMVKKLDEDGNEVEGLNIPMSVGPPVVDKDNAGAECVVYDVVINPNAVAECKADKTGARRDWLCHLALESVMRKHDCRLDSKYKLPKLTFKGDKNVGPAQQRIRDDSSKPQIQELSSNKSCGTAKTTGVASSAESKETSRPLTALKSTVTADWAYPRNEQSRQKDVSAISLEDTVRTPWQTWPDSLLVGVTGLQAECVCSEKFLAKMRVETSAFECSVNVVGHHPVQLRLPYAVLPETACARTNGHEGKLTVTVKVDKTPPEAAADAGSKPWLLARALHDGAERRAPTCTVGASSKGAGSGTEVKGEDVLPEDQFHLRLPKGVDQYTGIPLEQEDRQSTMDGPIGESDLLPEERFHRADMISQHMIDTRERQRQEKIERADKEREEQQKGQQDGVEYIDFDDYRPGGKWNPSVASPPQNAMETKSVESSTEADGGSRPHVQEAGRVLHDSLAGRVEGEGDRAGTELHAAHWSTLLD